MTELQMYWADSLTGGVAGSVDKISGSGLNDKDALLAVADGVLYPYWLDEDNAGAESSPRVISPDASAGDKRWVLADLTIENLNVLGDISITGDIGLSGLTASRLVASDASKNLVSSDLNSWVTGTANQITVTDDGDGTITLSAPQDIASGSSPIFATVKLSNLSDGYVPYHVDDSTGLADSPMYTDGTDMFLLNTSGRKITTTGVDITLSQTGGTYGESGLRVESKTGAHGATFYSSALDLVDFLFVTPSEASGFSIRFERRNASILPGNINGQFELGIPGNEFLIIGGALSGTRYTKFGFGTTSPEEDVHIVSFTSASTKPVLLMENKNADEYSATLKFRKTSASPADGDRLGTITFHGKDSGSTDLQYGYIMMKSSDVTDTDEAGEILINARVDGSDSSFIHCNGFNGSVGQGYIVFNDDSKDIDFRVESDNITNSFFIQGSTGNVGLATTDPFLNYGSADGDFNTASWGGLHISTARDFGGLLVEGQTASRIYLADRGAAADDKIFVISNDGGQTIFSSVLDDLSDYKSQNILVLDHGNGRIGLNNSSPGFDLHAQFEGAGPQWCLESTSDDNLAPAVYLFNHRATPTDDVLLGSIYFRADNSIGTEKNYVEISGYVEDVTSTDEAGRLDIDINIDNNSSNFLAMSGYNGSVGQGYIVFNEDSKDIDFRVESDNIENALFIEGSSGKVGIGTGSPKGDGVKLHISAGANADTNWYTLAPLVIENTNHAVINVRTPNNKIGGILFSDPDSLFSGWLEYSHSLDLLFMGIDPAGAGTYSQFAMSSLGANFAFGSASALGRTPLQGVIEVHKGDSDPSYLQFTNTTTGRGASHGCYFGLNANEHAVIDQKAAKEILFLTSATQRMTIDASGFVGINEPNPLTHLHISSTASDQPILRLETTSNDAQPSYLQFRKSSSSPADGDYIGGILFSSLDSVASALNYASIYGRSSDVTNNDESGEIVFLIRQDGSSREMFTMSGYNGTVGQGYITFNRAGVDIDFKIESENKDPIFFVDAGNDEIYLGDHTGGNYTKVETDGTLEFIGDATVWDDLKVSVGNISRPGASDPSWVAYDVNGGGINTYLLEYAKNDLGTFVVQLPHSYKEGTDISVHIHWTPGPNGAGENGNYVGWKVQYSWANIDGNFGNMSTADLSDVCDGTNHKHQMTPSATITGSGKTISSMLLCNIVRTDTGADDTWSGSGTGNLPLLMEVDFHFEINTVGSRQIGTK